MTVMLERNEKKDKKTAVLLILLTTVVYAISYVGRKSYDANINEVMSFFGVEKDVAGIVSTAFFISYGAGQVIHGLLCSKYNSKYAIFIAIIVGGACNLAIALLPSSAFGAIKYVWFINGFSQAALWSSMVLIFNKVLAEKYAGLALFIMCFPVPVGTFVGYGLSALFSYINNFKLTFYAAAFLMLAIGSVWIVFYGNLKVKCEEAKAFYDGPINEKFQTENGTNNKTPIAFWFLFGSMCLLAVVNNFVKDGLTTWTPTFLKESYGLENWFSVLLTLVLPLFALFGSSLVLVMNKKIKDYFVLSGLLFAVSAGVMGVMVACINLKTFVVSIVCFAVTACLMAGVNNVVTAIFPMDCKGKVNAGLVAGITDGFCYLGSAVSSVGFGSIAKNYDWGTVMSVILISLLIATAVCFGCFLVKTVKNRKKA